MTQLKYVLNCIRTLVAYTDKCYEIKTNSYQISTHKLCKNRTR